MKDFLTLTSIIAAAIWSQLLFVIGYKDTFYRWIFENFGIFIIIWVILIILGTPIFLVNKIINSLRGRFQ
jgi:membrane protein DedA with SNARE-associated domain